MNARPGQSATSPFDPTIDGSLSDAGQASGGPAAKVALIEGSTPHLATETHAVLRVRLRAAAVVLFVGTTLFLIWVLAFGLPKEDYNHFILGFHVVLAAVLGACSFLLCVRCPATLKRLRLYEVVIFGLPSAFFVALQYVRIHHCIEDQDLVQLSVALRGSAQLWFALIFTYSMFIPNSWRRVAVVAGAMAVAPIVLALVARYDHPLVAANFSIRDVVELFLMMLVAWMVAVYGAHNIGMLRREAFEAKRFGQYHLKSLIGAGGMGEVYLAEHHLLKRPCAIKLIRPGQATDPRALARFEREVRTTARLSHWNSVEIFDYGRTEDGTFYYVMEYLPGLNLATLVERFGPLPPERAIHLLRQTCDALREAHAAGLVHRDIKPGNIFSAQRGGVHDVAKLLDFGLVKPIVEEESMHLTREGAITGSPLYLSPEQAIGEHEPDQRSDIYSLGAVAYFLLTGRPPFNGDRPIKVLLAHAHDDVVPPSQLRAEVPADLEQVILRCLAKHPRDRYQDVDSLKRALGECELAGRWSDDDAARWWETLNTQAEPAAVPVA